MTNLQKTEPKNKRHRGLIRRFNIQLIRIPKTKNQENRRDEFIKKKTTMHSISCRERDYRMSTKMSEKRDTPGNFTVKFENARH